MVDTGTELNRLSGYIDKQANFVFGPRFNFAFSFKEGLASVSFSLGTSYISAYMDKRGQLIWQSK